MYSNSINIYPKNTVNFKAGTGTPAANSFAQNPINSTSFKGETQAQQQQPQPLVQAKPNIRTELATNEEKDKYIAIVSNLDKQDRKNVDLLLRSGILLNTNSNDKSSTLDNLYKIITAPRAAGLDAKVILKETVNAIANPFAITQKFGDIPKPYLNDIVQKAKPNPKTPDNQLTEKTIQVDHSSDCVSASIEFNLAAKMPAEFARFAEGLSSPKIAVDKTIDLKNLTDNTLDSVWLLNAFEVPYEMNNFDSAKLTLKPDKNAIIRAQIQTNHKDAYERSAVDVLMQSTFMNVGSQSSFDSLTDIRGGKFNSDNKGLIEFEKTFTESIVEDKNTISVTYQELDKDGKVTGHTKDFQNIEKQLLDSLAIGHSVIIGYTYTIKNKELQTPDPTKSPDFEITTGHEITVIGAMKDKNGKLIFICNDTDDDNPNPIAYPAEYIIPKIHHAGLPKVIAERDTKYEESWKEGLKMYQDAKKAPKS